MDLWIIWLYHKNKKDKNWLLITKKGLNPYKFNEKIIQEDFMNKMNYSEFSLMTILDNALFYIPQNTI